MIFLSLLWRIYEAYLFTISWPIKLVQNKVYNIKQNGLVTYEHPFKEKKKYINITHTHMFGMRVMLLEHIITFGTKCTTNGQPSNFRLGEWHEEITF